MPYLKLDDEYGQMMYATNSFFFIMHKMWNLCLSSTNDNHFYIQCTCGICTFTWYFTSKLCSCLLLFSIMVIIGYLYYQYTWESKWRFVKWCICYYFLATIFHLPHISFFTLLLNALLWIIFPKINFSWNLSYSKKILILTQNLFSHKKVLLSYQILWK